MCRRRAGNLLERHVSRVGVPRPFPKGPFGGGQEASPGVSEFDDRLATINRTFSSASNPKYRSTCGYRIY